MANASFLKSPEFLGGAIGGGLGALKGIFVNQPAYESQVASRAIEARFAPLQGKASPSFSDIEQPSAFQTAMDYGLTGIAQGQKIREAKEEKAFRKKLLDKLGPQNQAASFGAGSVPKYLQSPEYTAQQRQQGVEEIQNLANFGYIPDPNAATPQYLYDQSAYLGEQ